jgi:TolB-like protein
VLPLANASADPDQQYFSDGLSEDLITALSQFSGLKVISRNSSFRFRDSKEDARTIAAALGVAHLLEGSVRRVGEVVRISAELVNAADGSTLWSEHYDRPYADLFKLQDEITTAVAVALKARLSANTGAEVQSERPASGNLEAYKAYLQGKFYRARFNEADDRKAVEFFETATRLDPGYAQAWTLLAGSWFVIAGNYVGGAEADQIRAKGRSALDHAFAIAPNLSSAHRVRGHLLAIDEFNWAGDEAEQRLALQLEPGSGAAMFGLGQTLAALGQAADGVDLLRKSLAIDPLDANTYYWLSGYLPATGQLDEAEQAARQAVQLQPSAGLYATQLSIIQLVRGNPAAALRTAQATAPDWRDLAMAYALQAGDDRAAADAALKKVVDEQSGYAAFQIAEIYALRKQPDQAFEWLERAKANHDPGLQLLLTDALLKPYQADPRFAAFCRSINLPVPAETRS